MALDLAIPVSFCVVISVVTVDGGGDGFSSQFS